MSIDLFPGVGFLCQAYEDIFHSIALGIYVFVKQLIPIQGVATGALGFGLIE